MRRIAVLTAAGLVLLVLVVAQLVLPGVAAQELRDDLEQSGTVLEVKVTAFPAIKLLWHRADSVVVRMGRYRSGASQLGDTLGRAVEAGSLDASAQELDVGPLTLRDATLHKRGSELTGAATLTEADLRSVVFFLDNVEPVASGNGRLTLRGTASFLGLKATVDATVAAAGRCARSRARCPVRGHRDAHAVQRPARARAVDQRDERTRRVQDDRGG